MGDGEGGGGEDKVEEDKEERDKGFPTLDRELGFGRSLGCWKLDFYFDCRSISDSSWAGRRNNQDQSIIMILGCFIRLWK